MRFPTHIILDITKSNSIKTNQQWLEFYQNVSLTTEVINDILITSKLTYRVTRKPKTIRFRKNNKHYINHPLNDTNNSYNFLSNLFDINFIKREKLYTKLKYSRSPAYDIVSGGVAALFAGFIGFLISEKFGIELVDSGDFYTFFMYIVFLVFSFRPLVKILSQTDTIYSFFSIKFLLTYLHTITILVVKLIQMIYTKLPIPHNNFFKHNLRLFTTKNEYLTCNFRRFLAFIDFLLTYPNHKK